MGQYAELQAEAKRLGLKAGGTIKELSARIEAVKTVVKENEDVVAGACDVVTEPAVEPTIIGVDLATKEEFAPEPEIEAPKIAHKIINWGHGKNSGSYKLGDLLDHLRIYNKRTGTRIQVTTEDNMIHGFNKSSGSQSCTTMEQPVGKIKLALSKWAGVKFLPGATDPDEAFAIAEKDGNYDISDYSDIVMDTAPGMEQEGKNYTIG